MLSGLLFVIRILCTIFTRIGSAHDKITFDGNRFHRFSCIELRDQSTHCTMDPTDGITLPSSVVTRGYERAEDTVFDINSQMSDMRSLVEIEDICKGKRKNLLTFRPHCTSSMT